MIEPPLRLAASRLWKEAGDTLYMRQEFLLELWLKQLGAFSADSDEKTSLYLLAGRQEIQLLLSDLAVALWDNQKNLRSNAFLCSTRLSLSQRIECIACFRELLFKAFSFDPAVCIFINAFLDSTIQAVASHETANQERNFNLSMDKLEREKRLRDQFIMTLTHDLRTPLTVAIMNTQLLCKTPTDKAAIEKHSARILSSLERTNSMIDDLLDANRIRAGEKITLQFSEVQLNKLIYFTLDDLKSIYGDRFQVEESKDEICGKWNAPALQRIFENLCSNAVKYGDLRSPIFVRMGSTSSQAWFEVHNFGNPIPQHEQAELFELYKRSTTNSQNRQKGWGLGLTLVQGFTCSHNGTIRVESSQEKGTIFRVTLPLDPENAFRAKL